MLQELFKAIGDQAVRAHNRGIYRAEADPAHVYYLDANGDGALEKHEATPAPRSHHANDLSALVAFALECKATSEVWYSRKAVNVFLDRGTRRDRATLPLDFSTQMKALLALEANPKLFSQPDFLRLLRITLAGGGLDALITGVRNVHFKTIDDAAGTVAHGKASVGRKIESQLEGTALVPEDVVAWVPVFHGFLMETPFQVRCAVEIDTTGRQFALIPYPGTCEKAIREAEGQIGADLLALLESGDAEEGERAVPVYYGTP